MAKSGKKERKRGAKNKSEKESVGSSHDIRDTSIVPVGYSWENGKDNKDKKDKVMAFKKIQSLTRATGKQSVWIA